MKRSYLAVAVLAAGCAGAKPLPREQRPLAAVMPFSYEAGPPEFAKTAGQLSDALSGALLRTGRLRLVERQRVSTLLKEAKYSASGAVDPDTAVQVGRQLGAKAMVLGSIVSISVREEGRSVKFAEKTTRWAEVEAEARLVDIETGELLASGRAVGKAKSAEKHAFGGQIGELASPEALVQQAIQGLGEDLAEALAKEVRP